MDPVVPLEEAWLVYDDWELKYLFRKYKGSLDVHKKDNTIGKFHEYYWD